MKEEIQWTIYVQLQYIWKKTNRFLAAQTWTTANVKVIVKSNGFPLSMYSTLTLFHSLSWMFIHASGRYLPLFNRSMLLFVSCTKINNLNAFVCCRASTNTAAATTTTIVNANTIDNMVCKTNSCINV